MPATPSLSDQPFLFVPFHFEHSSVFGVDGQLYFVTVAIHMKINQLKKVQVEAKTLKLHLKVSDRFTGTLVDQDGQTLKDHDGYVPDFMPGEHYGDYVILDIDIDTGKITNWRTPSAEQIEEFINGESE